MVPMRIVSLDEWSEDHSELVGLLKRKDIEKKGRRNRELRGGLYFWRDEIFELGSGCGCGMGRTGVELSRIRPHDVHGVLLAGSQGQVERVDSGQQWAVDSTGRRGVCIPPRP